jgi:hypothetical protein
VRGLPFLDSFKFYEVQNCNLGIFSSPENSNNLLKFLRINGKKIEGLLLHLFFTLTCTIRVGPRYITSQEHGPSGECDCLVAMP